MLEYLVLINLYPEYNNKNNDNNNNINLFVICECRCSINKKKHLSITIIFWTIFIIMIEMEIGKWCTHLPIIAPCPLLMTFHNVTTTWVICLIWTSSLKEQGNFFGNRGVAWIVLVPHTLYCHFLVTLTLWLLPMHYNVYPPRSNCFKIFVSEFFLTNDGLCFNHAQWHIYLWIFWLLQVISISDSQVGARWQSCIFFHSLKVSCLDVRSFIEYRLSDLLLIEEPWKFANKLPWDVLAAIFWSDHEVLLWLL